MRNYAVEASDLLTRWKRGEDVQDTLAHQLRHVSAGLNTTQAEVVALRGALTTILADFKRHGQSVANHSDGEYSQDYTTRLQLVEAVLR